MNQSSDHEAYNTKYLQESVLKAAIQSTMEIHFWQQMWTASVADPIMSEMSITE